MSPFREAVAPVVEIGRSGALVVRLGNAEFALPVDLVREVSRVPRITRIPFSPAHIVGVIALRGSILAVLDLRERLLGEAARRDGRIVVVEDPFLGGRIALLVDRVIDLIARDGELADPPTEVIESLPSGWITAVLAPSEERLVAVLDLAAVLTPAGGSTLPSYDTSSAGTGPSGPLPASTSAGAGQPSTIVQPNHAEGANEVSLRDEQEPPRNDTETEQTA